MPANEFTLQQKLTLSRSAELTLWRCCCSVLLAAMKSVPMYSMLSSHIHPHTTQMQGI